MSDANVPVAAAAAQARQAGFTVYEGAPNRIMLDLDGKQWPGLFDNRVATLLYEQFGLTVTEVWTSKSGTGEHVLITLDKPLPILARLLIQALLGSDPMREALALVRHLNYNEAEPSLLFRPAQKKEEACSK